MCDAPSSHAVRSTCARSPFKKPKQDDRSKWTIGVLLGLGLLAFWTHRAPDTYDQRQNMQVARSDLRPLVGTETRPSGGGMVDEGRAAAAPDSATDDAAAAALSAKADGGLNSASSTKQQQPPQPVAASAAAASGGGAPTNATNGTRR